MFDSLACFLSESRQLSLVSMSQMLRAFHTGLVITTELELLLPCWQVVMTGDLFFPALC
jgi:hypothetical protein